jgi:hypothetical protein
MSEKLCQAIFAISKTIAELVDEISVLAVRVNRPDHVSLVFPALVELSETMKAKVAELGETTTATTPPAPKERSWLDVPPPPSPPPPEKEPLLTPAEDLMATLMAGHARFMAGGPKLIEREMLFLVKALQNLNDRVGALEPPKYGIEGVPEHDCVWTYGPAKCRGRCVSAIKAASRPDMGQR